MVDHLLCVVASCYIVHMSRTTLVLHLFIQKNGGTILSEQFCCTSPCQKSQFVDDLTKTTTTFLPAQRSTLQTGLMESGCLIVRFRRERLDEPHEPHIINSLSIIDTSPNVVLHAVPDTVVSPQVAVQLGFHVSELIPHLLFSRQDPLFCTRPLPSDWRCRQCYHLRAHSAAPVKSPHDDSICGITMEPVGLINHKKGHVLQPHKCMHQ
mmetsp:Transcript_117921/g.234913  ORF Transcript_117921/g.234913 Transcript_117921/m.234913 type:complete len:209 (-) Transcript_117921:462-1088(-)